MGPFVILALVLATFSLGMVVVAAVVLWRSLTELRTVAEAMTGQLEPLRAELEAEAAVAALELEAIQRRRDAHHRQRGARRATLAARSR